MAARHDLALWARLGTQQAPEETPPTWRDFAPFLAFLASAWLLLTSVGVGFASLRLGLILPAWAATATAATLRSFAPPAFRASYPGIVLALSLATLWLC